MKFRIASIVGLFSALALSGAAYAAGPAPVALQSDVKIEKTVTESGETKTVLAPVTRAVPGNKLLFTTGYRNAGATRIDNFVVTNPLPKGVVYVADPADNGQVSVNGGKTWGQLANLTVVAADGSSRPATEADVTHIRWVIPTIAPGGSGMVSYHAVVR
ncbi:MAG: hypothetical protein JSR96_12115 [Proteobacteria bacterium]|nr:hypothetical protein [Pseudomonadota bacterium]